MKKLVFFLVSLMSLPVMAAGIYVQPRQFSVLTTAAGPVAAGRFDNLNMSLFNGDPNLAPCEVFKGSSTHARAFTYRGVVKIGMVIGSESYTYMSAVPTYVLFKTTDGCKAGNFADAISVGELAFSNDQFPNVKVLVTYSSSGNLQIVNVPSGVMHGHLALVP